MNKIQKCLRQVQLGLGIKSGTRNPNRTRTEKPDPLSDSKRKNTRTNFVGYGTKNIRTRSVINRTRTDNPKNPKLIVNINILKYI